MVGEGFAFPDSGLACAEGAFGAEVVKVKGGFTGPDLGDDALFVGNALVGAADNCGGGVLGKDDNAVSVADHKVAGRRGSP